jgi:hypothetical protein
MKRKLKYKRDQETKKFTVVWINLHLELIYLLAHNRQVIHF